MVFIFCQIFYEKNPNIFGQGFYCIYFFKKSNIFSKTLFRMFLLPLFAYSVEDNSRRDSGIETFRSTKSRNGDFVSDVWQNI